MSDTKFNIPDSLEEALKAKQVVPFTGAGVSMSIKKSPLEPLLDKDGKEKKDKLGETIHKSLFVSWWEFLSSAADKLDKEKIALNADKKSQKAITIRTLLNDSPVDYLDIAQRAFDALQPIYWYDLITDNFEKDIDSADEGSKKLAKLIWKLGSNLVVTTNIDLVLQSVHENSARVKVLDTQVPEFGELQKNWQPSRPTALHLHGHVDSKSNIVFTKDQYKEFYNLDKNRAKLETLRSLFTQRTILFIGFSLDDLYVLKELERVNLIYKGGANRFFALIRESERDNPNIPNYIQQINFPEFGKPLEDLVEELAQIAKGDDVNEADKSSLETTKPEISSEAERLKNHFNVPFATKGDAFVGRDGLREKIWESLSKSGRTAISQIVNIKGIGGLGKTQLAVEYAYSYQSKYENGVFWLTADQDIDVQLIKIGGDLRWISESDTGFDQAALVRNRFRKLSDCLIIFDNVDDKNAIENYLPETTAHPHILITSREKQSHFDEINLDVLSRDESRRLLSETSGRTIEDEIERESFERILDELGDLPLAVELVGGFLAEHTGISFEQYLKFLEDVPLAALEEDFPSISFTHHDKSIIRTLKISEKVLAKKPYLEDILDILAWSGKSSMGYSLLQDLTEIKEDYKLTVALSDLANLRLIKEEKQSKRYTIHRLVARVRKFERPLAERKEWQQKIFGKLIEWFRARKDDFKFLTEFEVETIHLQEWQIQSSNISPIESVYAIAFRSYPLWHRGIYQESKVLLDKALSLYQANSLSDYQLLADLYNDLSVIIGALGNHKKALKYQEQALKIRRELFGEKHSETAASLGNLALTYGDLGNHEEALKYQEQALKIRRELLGEKHPDTATSLSNLGSTYGYLGNYKEALKYKGQALEIRYELFGEKHPDTAISLSNLGSTYGYLGNYKEALKYQEQALKIRRELLGEKHPDTATSLGNLGFIYGDLGKHKEALKYQEQALEILRELFGEKHPETVTLLGNLGLAYDYLGNYKEALKYHEQALEVRRELFGERHPNTIIVARNLINTYLKIGYKEKAEILAAEFLSYISQNHPKRKFFEKHGAKRREINKKLKKIRKR